MRQKLKHFFSAQQFSNRSDIIVGTGSRDRYSLSDGAYHDRLSRVKYFFSGGIYDKFIPPKYFEICNYGACLVSPELPLMRECGWIPNVNYIKLENVNDIFDILESDLWERVGKAGRELVQSRHTVEQRAETLMKYFLRWRACEMEGY
ncbi:unnamed protein product [marine sediment metagenome]|uniref:Spore protein YkvP/CgeB glycosyl transferase-like domain-containing protein n=1 Tax=marine sediment metagenome TaxID=412755 RepID=X1D0A9_9ZZZZ